MSSIYDIDVVTIDGKSLKLSEYQGKTLLIVNTASECGLTPQYEALEKLYQARKDEGLVILGFPCNQFGAQEPGQDSEIQSFCTKNYGVSFPMFSKLEVNGDGRHPLYQALYSAMPERTTSLDSEFVDLLQGYGFEVKEGNILWNFEKFLVSKDGKVIGHFAPDMTPDHPILTRALDDALAK
ncbi:glutathione peroxidase [Celerinatantimonas diazotrophica]|uniref:Glutathione peroxidase n=1 Tax=Celerinatantimonas diazotrophica TaxID=412034 RepID=A0A4R1JLY8_9GAMM|nr:glutathione peroxidase [Celerinatantimonas diazotrophica]TCK51960.1 glutathione peroxidase [Celerinatantimonas diazotrophica]CAG9296340.1 Thioredoxin/glutathione peroxidase BtuE [Celerinatantimonas diazotrophica]